MSPEKKNICVFTAFSLPHTGGVERYAEGFTAELARLGFNVTIVTFNTENIQSLEKIDNRMIYRLPCVVLFNKRFPVPKFNRKFFALWSEIKKNKFDLFIINQRFYTLSLIAAHLGKKTATDAYLFEHVTGHFKFNNKILGKISHYYEHRVSSYTLKRCIKFFGVSEACCKWLEHFSVKSEEMVYNSVPLIKPNPVACPKIVDSFPRDYSIITYAGRLITEKGIAILLEAFEKINVGEKLKLVIAGGGELAGFLKDKCKNNSDIIALGAITHESVLALIEKTAIAVIPSCYPEGLSTFLLEAGSAGCAVVATDMGGNSEVIINDEFGLIIPPQSVESLTEAMSKLIQDRELCIKMGKNLQKRIIENFTWERNVKDFISK